MQSVCTDDIDDEVLVFFCQFIASISNFVRTTQFTLQLDFYVYSYISGYNYNRTDL